MEPYPSSPGQTPYDPSMPQPMTAYPHGIFRKGLVMNLVFVGIVMIFMGLLVLTSMVFVEAPTGSGDYDSYRDTIRNMAGTGRLVIVLGGLLSSIGLVCGGIAAEDMNDKIRAVMVSAGVAVVIATLIVLGMFAGTLTV